MPTVWLDGFRSPLRARVEARASAARVLIRYDIHAPSNRPRANVVGSKAPKLKRKLVVVFPVLSASPQPGADCLPLFTAGSFPIERHDLVVQSHIVEVDTSMRQKSQWVDCMRAPETVAVAQADQSKYPELLRTGLSANASTVQSCFIQVSRTPSKLLRILRPSRVETEILRPQRDLLPAHPQCQVIGAGPQKTDFEESLMYVELLVVETRPWTSVPAVFDTARKFTEEAETFPKMQIHMRQISLHQIYISARSV